MKIVCAWCPDGSPTKDMGESEPLDDDSVSHGICASCLEKQNAKLDELKKRRREQGR